MMAFIGSWMLTALSAVVNFQLSTSYRLLWQHQLSPALAACKRALVNIDNYSGWNNFYKLSSKNRNSKLVLCWPFHTPGLHQSSLKIRSDRTRVLSEYSLALTFTFMESTIRFFVVIILCQQSASILGSLKNEFPLPLLILLWYVDLSHTKIAL